jgi:hypothetical protein
VSFGGLYDAFFYDSYGNYLSLSALDVRWSAKLILLSEFGAAKFPIPLG